MVADLWQRRGKISGNCISIVLQQCQNKVSFQKTGSVGPGWEVCRMRGDLSYVKIACAAVFVLQNNSSIVSFCCFTKILGLEPQLKFKVRGREIDRARQTFQSGCWHCGKIFSKFFERKQVLSYE